MGISLALVFISHPSTSLFLSGILFVYGVAVILLSGADRKTVSGIGILFISGFALGLALSSPYWFHVLQLKHLIQLHLALTGHYNVINWVADPIDFILPSIRSQWFYQLGPLHLVLCAAGAYLNRKDARIVVAFVLYLLAILSLTSLGSGLWSFFDIVRYVQFPWRIQAVLATLQIIGVAGVCIALAKRPSMQSGVMFVAFFLSLMWYNNLNEPKGSSLPKVSPSWFREIVDYRLSMSDVRRNTFSVRLEYAPLNSVVLVRSKPSTDKPPPESRTAPFHL
ncbi:MAG: hypothetical protein OEZ04_06895 [Nitrospinota bacterium]|nr:hypothetical protein [Nitrospinota bacterium]